MPKALWPRVLGFVGGGMLTLLLFTPSGLATKSSLPPPGGSPCDSEPTGFLHVTGKDTGVSDVGNVHGVHAKITAVGFDNAGYQCHTVRSILALNDVDNAVEIGWRKVNGDGDDSHTVFYFSIQRGVARPEQFSNRHPVDGQEPDFKIQNGNGNNYWALNYQDDYLDSVHEIFTSARFAITNSEKHYFQDSLYAHFHGLGVCTSNDCTGPYHSFDALSEDMNNTDNWRFCWVSRDEHYVRQDNC